MQSNAALYIKPAIRTSSIGPTTSILIIELNDEANVYSLP